MDADSAAATAAAAATASVKTPEAETEAPTRIQPSKPLSFTNGVLKRHHPLHHHHPHPHHLNGPPVVVIYKECLKNHAASLGAHAVDGCGEFMPSPTANSTDPTSLKCAACGCHRNFHRREPEEPLPSPTAAIEYQPHHRHHPPPPLLTRGGHSSPNSSSPPPISSSYYPSAPHMLLALSAGGISGPPPENNPAITPAAGTTAAVATTPNGRKRFRTKFTQDQKERMHQFAERLGWKMQKRDEELIAEFCSEVRVDRGVFKVWMHNNKSTFRKKETNAAAGSTPTTNCIDIGSRNSLDNNPVHYPHHHPHNDDNDNHHHNRHNDTDNSVSEHAVAANGSSSSS